MPTELTPNIRNKNHPAEVRPGCLVDVLTPTVNQQFELGTKYTTRLGKIYRYAQAGAVNLVKGDLQQSAIYNGALGSTVQFELTVVVNPLTSLFPAIGDSVVCATLAGSVTTQTLDRFSGGIMIVNTGTGAGQMHMIDGHAAAVNGATITLNLAETLELALDTTSRITLYANPYLWTIQAPATTPTGVTLGIAPCAVTAKYFYWAQTGGWAAANVKTALTAGTAVVRDVAAAGSVGVQAAGASSLATEVVGYTGWVTATTHIGLVYLTLDK
jgi:hypothetical protein